jgi:hypothetical protein
LCDHGVIRDRQTDELPDLRGLSRMEARADIEAGHVVVMDNLSSRKSEGDH